MSFISVLDSEGQQVYLNSDHIVTLKAGFEAGTTAMVLTNGKSPVYHVELGFVIQQLEVVKVA